MVNPKTKQLLKNLAKAGQQMKESQSRQESVVAQLEKVKSLSQQRSVPKRQLSEELEVLSRMLGGISEMQTTLLRREDEQAAEVKQELREVKLKLSLMQGGELSRKLDRIGFLIGELTARVNNYVDIKTDRERRVEELENKIKQQVSLNYRELQKLEHALEELQGKYEELREGGRYSKDHLMSVEKKLDELRLSLLKKKEELINKRQAELMLPKVGGLQRKLLPAPRPQGSMAPPPSRQSKLFMHDQPVGKPAPPRAEFKPGVPPMPSMAELSDDDELPPFPEELGLEGEPVSGQHKLLFPRAGRSVSSASSSKMDEVGGSELAPPPFEDLPPFDVLQDLPPPPAKSKRGGLLGFVHKMFGRREKKLY